MQVNGRSIGLGAILTVAAIVVFALVAAGVTFGGDILLIELTAVGLALYAAGRLF